MIHSLVLKIAERCNLNCGYCYMYQHADQSYLQRPKLMSDETFAKTLERVVQHCDRHGHQMSLGLHGGEPTLVGSRRMDRLLRLARRTLGKRLSDISMQTNATLIDEKWLAVLRRHRVKVGVSLDGPPEVHDSERVDFKGAGSYERTVAGLQLLRRGGLLTGVLCVLRPGADGAAVYRHFRSLGLRQMSFLLPDATHDTKKRLYGKFGPTPVADYLIPAFDAWFDEDDPRVKARTFLSVIMAMNGHIVDSDAFGNPPLAYVMIESDGSIQSLDALKVCAEGAPETKMTVFSSAFDDLGASSPELRRWLKKGMPLPSGCRSCPERKACGGGYHPHRYSRARGFDNPSIWCEDIKLLFAHVRKRAGDAIAA